MSESTSSEFTLVSGEFLTSPVDEADRTTLLSKGHLGAVALALPRWTLSVKSSVDPEDMMLDMIFDDEFDESADNTEARIIKCFRRGLPDLHPRFQLGMRPNEDTFMEAYNRLGGDPERSDSELTKILGVPYLSGLVDRTGFDFFEAEVECGENDIPGITILDAKKVAAAEAYLIEQELVRGKSTGDTTPPEDLTPTPSPVVPTPPADSGSVAVEVPVNRVIT